MSSPEVVQGDDGKSLYHRVAVETKNNSLVSITVQFTFQYIIGQNINWLIPILRNVLQTTAKKMDIRELAEFKFYEEMIMKQCKVNLVIPPLELVNIIHFRIQNNLK